MRVDNNDAGDVFVSLRLKMLVLAALPVLLAAVGVGLALSPMRVAQQVAGTVVVYGEGIGYVRDIGHALVQRRDAQLMADASGESVSSLFDQRLQERLEAFETWLSQQDGLGAMQTNFGAYHATVAALARSALATGDTGGARSVIARFEPSIHQTARLMDRAAVVIEDPDASAQSRAMAVLYRLRSSASLVAALLECADAREAVTPDIAIALNVAANAMVERAGLYNLLLTDAPGNLQVHPTLDAINDLGWQTMIDDAQAQQEVRELTAELLNALGYGGFIHAFKNYVLRGTDRYRETIEDRVERARAVLDRMDDQARLAGLAAETVSDVRRTVDAYYAQLDDVRQAHARGALPSEIDALVRVDDAPALNAIARLTRWEAPLAPDARVRLRERMGTGFDSVGAALSQAMARRADTLYYSADRAFRITLIVGGLVALLVIAIGVSTFRRLSGGLQNFTADLKHVTTTGALDLLSDGREVRSDEIGQLEIMVRRYNQRIAELADSARALAEGDTSTLPEPLGPDDVLAHALVSLGHSAQAMERQAQKIADGDYHAAVAVRSERDTLSLALNAMAEALSGYRVAVDASAWRAGGQLEVLRAMRRPRSATELSASVVDTLLRFLEADVGAFYVVLEDGLRLEAQSGLPDGIDWPTRFDPDQGQLGRALSETQTRVLTDLPADYLPVVSGLGRTATTTVTLTPLRGQGRVVGLLELAWRRSPPADVALLLDSVGESIALAMDAIQGKVRTEQLLEETRAMATKLEEQQEELRVSNEELEEQTQALRQSEEELKQQREELRTSNEELEEKSEVLSAERAKLEETAESLQRATQYKSEFLANMSHELRTPLNSMLILSKQLADNEDGNLSDDQSQSARVVYESGRDLLTLINEILDLSKVEAGQLAVHPETFPLSGMLGTLERQFQPMAKAKGVEFRIERDRELPAQLHTDTQRLQQIIRNLISNAIKFTSTGSVTLKVGRPDATMPQPKGPDGPWPVEQLVAFSVIDTGIGIDPSKLEDIFNPFVQADGSTSRQYGGTGLGLSISREMSSLLGGVIHATSQPGVGSIFTTIVPQAFNGDAPDLSAPMPQPVVKPVVPPAPQDTAAASVAPQVPDDRADVTSPGDSVLVIEDDVSFAAIVRDQIRDRGRKALVATDGRNGLALATQYRPQGIILDLHLPDMGGQEVLAALKQSLETRHIPVHIVSSADKSVQSLRMGAVGFLAKPVSLEDLAEALGRVESAHDERRRVLVLEDDPKAQTAIRTLLENDQTQIEVEGSGERGLALVAAEHFDCIVLDLKLDDIDGMEFLQRLRATEAEAHPPVVIYTGRDLTREEHRELSALAESVVVKGAESPERLLDEVTLFVHALNEKLPDQQRQILQRLHDGPGVFDGKRVLVVDDDLRNTFALSGSLKKKGFEIHIADNGQMALDKLAELGSVDLVLMDIMMPVMDGYEAMGKMRADERFAHIPVIALTAKAMAEDRRKCIEAGANDYLTKPIDMDRLLAMIRVWLGRAA
ncbi:MAG: hypothetical protein CMP06_08725 [Xanthomonadales bacterium]|nr:hypothetical protein [Xanthomonadales bacterium]